MLGLSSGGGGGAAKPGGGLGLPAALLVDLREELELGWGEGGGHWRTLKGWGELAKRKLEHKISVWGECKY